VPGNIADVFYERVVTSLVVAGVCMEARHLPSVLAMPKRFNVKFSLA